MNIHHLFTGILTAHLGAPLSQESEVSHESPTTISDLPPPKHKHTMGYMKNYLLDLVCACSPEHAFGQDAVEHAIITGAVRMTYDKPRDVIEILSHYDEIVVAYQQFLRAEIKAELEEHHHTETAA